MEKILEFLLNIIEDILPFFVIKEYEQAVLLRGGKYYKTYKKGLYFKIPFLDNPIKTVVATTTLTIPTQSVTTLDQKQLVVKAIVKYNVEDIKLFILEVYDAVDAISDTVQGIIKEQINQKTWEECNSIKFDNEITKKLRVEIKKWGINVDKVTLTDIGIIKSIRLFNENIINN